MSDVQTVTYYVSIGFPHPGGLMINRARIKIDPQVESPTKGAKTFRCIIAKDPNTPHFLFGDFSKTPAKLYWAIYYHLDSEVPFLCSVNTPDEIKYGKVTNATPVKRPRKTKQTS